MPGSRSSCRQLEEAGPTLFHLAERPWDSTTNVGLPNGPLGYISSLRATSSGDLGLDRKTGCPFWTGHSDGSGVANRNSTERHLL